MTVLKKTALATSLKSFFEFLSKFKVQVFHKEVIWEASYVAEFNF